MSDQQADATTPASPEAAPSKAHGDALVDQSGSRHGIPPEDSRMGDDESGGDEGS